VPAEYDVLFNVQFGLLFDLFPTVSLCNHGLILRAECALLLKLLPVNIDILLLECLLAAPDLLELLLLAEFFFVAGQLLAVDPVVVLLHEQPLLHLLDAAVVVDHLGLGFPGAPRVGRCRVLHHYILQDKIMSYN
jgi:hypothetical protein